MANVTGYRAVRRELEALRKRPEAMARGLKKGGLYLQRLSQQIVPVDTGVLRNSAFTRAAFAFEYIVVTVGYTANYAIFVHENPDAQHAAGKQYKFLEAPFRENRQAILDIIKKEMTK